MTTRLTYPIVIEILALEDGGGFLALAPDLPRCMGNGDSPEEAVTHVQDAIDTWIKATHDRGRTVPPRPGTCRRAMNKHGDKG